MKKNAMLLAAIVLGILPMIAFDFAVAHFMGKDGTLVTMLASLFYAFGLLRPAVMWLDRKLSNE